jgi:hypothetical protein
VSTSTLWRWLKVPRALSWPLNRTGTLLGQQRREGQGFGIGPVDSGAVFDRLEPPGSSRSSFEKR